VGARAVGIAGSQEKCDYAVRELGYTACINHRSADLAGQIRATCPGGVDVYFDNLGGEVLATVVNALAPHARVIFVARARLTTGKCLHLGPRSHPC